MDEDNRAMIASRVFKAPRSLVYQLFTSLEHIDNWYGPEGCQTVTSHLDLRQGGIWKYTMNLPNGSSFESHNIYAEIVNDDKRGC